MDPILEKAYSIEDFRKNGHQVIEMLADYLENAMSNRDNDTVMPWRTPEDQLAYWQGDFSRPSDGDPVALFKDVMARSIQIHRKKYFGHQTAATLPISALSAAVSTMMNQGMGVYEMGMVGNALEKVLTEFVAQKLGFGQEASGFITSGGSLGNLTALLAARAVPTDVWENGLQQNQNFAIMVSEESHYCIDRAVRIMGLGAQGIIKVPVNDRFQMRTDLLEEYYQQAVAQGKKVLAVVGCSGTTSTGSFDDLVGIGDFCAQHQLWFHVDGAHGAAAAFAPKYQSLITGIERADSVILDFHKMMMTPSLSTAVIFKRGADAFSTFSQRAQYLWSEQSSEEWYNSGKRSFECTKVMTSLNVYTIFKTYGEEIFQKNVETLFGLAAEFAAMIDENPEFELAYQPECNIVCFRYHQDQRMNQMIREQLMMEGKFYIVQTILNGEHYLRVSIMNPLSTIDDLRGLLAEIERMAGQLSVAAR